MNRAILVTGRLIGPKNVELDEPLDTASGPVEVIIRASPADKREFRSLCEFLRGLPPSQRDRAEINHQIQQERDSWGER